jgi:hypothetical protein
MLDAFKCSRKLVATFIRELQADAKDPSDLMVLLPTTGHVRWAMELIGHSFVLPMEDHGTIKVAVEIYLGWLIKAGAVDVRPAPIQRDECSFFKDIFCHLSLLFEPRERSLMNSHIDLCKRVLKDWTHISQSKLDKATWEVLLAVALGMTHRILVEPTEGTSEASLLGQRLEQPLVVMLFTLWLRSRTMNPKLWAAFSRLAQQWCHRHHFINNLFKLNVHLTKRVICILASQPNAASDSVHWNDNEFISFK